MTIEFNEESYIIGLWFSTNPITGNNWLAAILRDPDNPERFKGSYRFRYIKDNKVFDSRDEKSWTDFICPEHATEEEILKFMDVAQKGIEEGYPDKDKIIVLGGVKKLMELSKDKSWMFIKSEKVE